MPKRIETSKEMVLGGRILSRNLLEDIKEKIAISAQLMDKSSADTGDQESEQVSPEPENTDYANISLEDAQSILEHSDYDQTIALLGGLEGKIGNLDKELLTIQRRIKGAIEEHFGRQYPAQQQRDLEDEQYRLEYEQAQQIPNWSKDPIHMRYRNSKYLYSQEVNIDLLNILNKLQENAGRAEIPLSHQELQLLQSAPPEVLNSGLSINENGTVYVPPSFVNPLRPQSQEQITPEGQESLFNEPPRSPGFNLSPEQLMNAVLLGNDAEYRQQYGEELFGKIDPLVAEWKTAFENKKNTVNLYREVEQKSKALYQEAIPEEFKNIERQTPQMFEEFDPEKARQKTQEIAENRKELAEKYKKENEPLKRDWKKIRELRELKKKLPLDPVDHRPFENPPVETVSKSTESILQEFDSIIKNNGTIVLNAFSDSARQLAALIEGNLTLPPEGYNDLGRGVLKYPGDPQQFEEEENNRDFSKPKEIAAKMYEQIGKLAENAVQFAEAVTYGQKQDLLGQRFKSFTSTGLTIESLRKDLLGDEENGSRRLPSIGGRQFNDYADYEILNYFGEASEKYTTRRPFFYKKEVVKRDKQDEQAQGPEIFIPSVEVRKNDKIIELSEGGEGVTPGNFAVANRKRSIGDVKTVNGLKVPQLAMNFTERDGWVLTEPSSKRLQLIQDKLNEGKEVSAQETQLLSDQQAFEDAAGSEEYLNFVDDAKKGLINDFEIQSDNIEPTETQRRNLFSWILSPLEWATKDQERDQEEDAPEEGAAELQGEMPTEIKTVEDPNGLEETPEMESLAPSDVQQFAEEQSEEEEASSVDDDEQILDWDMQIEDLLAKVDALAPEGVAAADERRELLDKINSLNGKIEERINEIEGGGKGQYEQASLDRRYKSNENWKKQLSIPTMGSLDKVAQDMVQNLPRDVWDKLADPKLSMKVLAQYGFFGELVSSMLRNDEGPLGKRLDRIKSSQKLAGMGLTPASAENNLYDFVMNNILDQNKVANLNAGVSQENVDDNGTDPKKALRRFVIPGVKNGQPFQDDGEDIPTSYVFPRKLTNFLVSRSQIGGDDVLLGQLSNALQSKDSEREVALQNFIKDALYKYVGKTMGMGLFGISPERKRAYREAKKMEKEWNSELEKTRQGYLEEFGGDEEKTEEAIISWVSKNPPPILSMTIKDTLYDPTDPAQMGSQSLAEMIDGFSETDEDPTYKFTEALMDMTTNKEYMSNDQKRKLDTAISALSEYDEKFKLRWSFFADPTSKDSYFKKQMFAREGEDPADTLERLENYYEMVSPRSRKASLKNLEENGPAADFTAQWNWPAVIKNFDRLVGQYPGFEYHVGDKIIVDPNDPELTDELKKNSIDKLFNYLILKTGNSIESQERIQKLRGQDPKKPGTLTPESEPRVEIPRKDKPKSEVTDMAKQIQEQLNAFVADWE